MNIYITRHGQTDYNKQSLLQGRRDISLNETGRSQAVMASAKLEGIKFDAVYASPLDRAIETASLLSGLDRSEIIIDRRIIEVDFGDYEAAYFYSLPLKMSLYWAFPEIFKAPESVETVKQMVSRSREFIGDLKKQPYENVLVVCHGGIIRAICGVLENKRLGIKWRPRPKNCEIRKYEIGQ